MRRLLGSLLVLLLTATLVVAAEVTFVGYDPRAKELTVREGDREAKYQVTDTTAVTFNGKPGDLRVLEGMRAGKTKFDLTSEDGRATAIKVTFKAKSGK